MSHKLTCNGKTYACAIGRGGLTPAQDKREGDGCTPMGTFPLRECWYRPDRIIPPQTALPLRVIKEDDGWCDAPGHELYNRHFKIPLSRRRPGSPLSPSTVSEIDKIPACAGMTPSSFERLWRQDHAYDLIIPLGYNDDPPVPGKGSAIFLHCMHDDGRATAGCVALAKEDLLMLLPKLSRDSTIRISSKQILMAP